MSSSLSTEAWRVTGRRPWASHGTRLRWWTAFINSTSWIARLSSSCEWQDTRFSAYSLCECLSSMRSITLKPLQYNTSSNEWYLTCDVKSNHKYTVYIYTLTLVWQPFTLLPCYYIQSCKLSYSTTKCPGTLNSAHRRIHRVVMALWNTQNFHRGGPGGRTFGNLSVGAQLGYAIHWNRTHKLTSQWGGEALAGSEWMHTEK